MEPPQETLASLIGRYLDPDGTPVQVPRVSLSAALREGDDPLHILRYLAGLGLSVSCLDDLLLINADEGEEELHGFRVAEGVAMTVSSDGLWVLFVA